MRATSINKLNRVQDSKQRNTSRMQHHEEEEEEEEEETKKLGTREGRRR